MNKSIRAKIRTVEAESSKYARYHLFRALRKQVGVAKLVEVWDELSHDAKTLALSGCSQSEAADAAELLATRLVAGQDRDLIASKLLGFRQIRSLVEPIIAVYPELPVQLQKEAQWFLLESGTGVGLRFLRQLAEQPGRSLRHLTIERRLRDGILGSLQERMVNVAAKFRGFYRNVDEADVQAWLSQFDTDVDRLLMLPLLERIVFFDSAAIQRSCAELWLSIPEDARREARVAGLGPAYKSGHHLLYEFRPDSTFRPKDRIRDLTSIVREAGPPRPIVFIDDVIGSGKQAVRFHSDLLEGRSEWCPLSNEERLRFKSARKFYLAVAGFRDGIDYVERNGGFEQVIVAHRFDEKDRAFHDGPEIYGNAEDLNRAERVARFWGQWLYPGDPTAQNGSGPGPLGYEGSQALVAFYYNVPNNTLPIIWAKGRIRGRDWCPLLERRQ